ncbi:hypothetical protein [Lacticaseibacillus suilingensis]|jgi:hypothetical protein
MFNISLLMVIKPITGENLGQKKASERSAGFLQTKKHASQFELG